jgi:hypothetical protein
MKIAIRIAGAMTVPKSRPAGQNQEIDGWMDSGVAVPAYTLTSAYIEMTTRMMTSKPSRKYCRRADTSIPR